VLATQRSDGMMILDSAKAADAASPGIATSSAISDATAIESGGYSSIAASSIGNKSGYLQGQVFNAEELVPEYDLITIKYVPSLAMSISFTSDFDVVATNAYRTSLLWQPPSFAYPNAIQGLDPDIINGSGIESLLLSQPYTARSFQLETYPDPNPFTDSALIQYRHVSYSALKEAYQIYGLRYLIFVYSQQVIGSIGSIDLSFGTMSIQLDKPILTRQIVPGTEDPVYRNIRYDGDPSEILNYGIEDFDRPYSVKAKKRKGWVDMRWLTQTKTSSQQDNNDFSGGIFSALCAVQIDMLNPKDITFLEPVIQPTYQAILRQRQQTISF
jgi:hypothetical protein